MPVTNLAVCCRLWQSHDMRGVEAGARPINRSVLELGEVEDGGGELDGAVVGALGLAVAQAHEGVDAALLGLQVPVRDGEEGAHHVDVHEHAVVLLGGRDVVLAHLLRLVQVVPVLLPVELVDDRALLLHVRHHVELRDSLLSQAHRRVVAVQVAGDCHRAVLVDDHHVLVGPEGEGDDEGVDVDRVVLLAAALGKPVAEAHEGVDLGLGRGLGPGGDDQEGADDVAVDGEVEELVGGVDAGLVEGVGSAEIVPVLGLEQAVDGRPDVEQRHLGASLGRGHGGVVVVGVVGVDCPQQAQHQQHCHSSVHIFLIYCEKPGQPLNLSRT